MVIHDEVLLGTCVQVRPENWTIGSVIVRVIDKDGTGVPMPRKVPMVEKAASFSCRS